MDTGSIDEKINRLKLIIGNLDYDQDRLLNKNVKAAGTNMRGQLMLCQKLCTSLRKDIMAKVKSIPKVERKSRKREALEQLAELEKDTIEPIKVEPPKHSGEENFKSKKKVEKSVSTQPRMRTVGRPKKVAIPSGEIQQEE